MAESIAVIGTECRFPSDADTPSKLWYLIHHPRDLSHEPSASRFNADVFYHPDSDTTNVAQFDTVLFNVQASEAEAIDPQHRLLLEVVYDGLSAAGQPMEKLRGFETAVYVGVMRDDYNTMVERDWETMPRYTATDLARSLAANRVSYFFD
ncbi:hybrid PKS-NRPS synthetase fsa1 [Hirsutella rhossiliensis]|uniref:Hybrid PKS-NRPS synthetase fsa1 n=1 Tax=Hirsutella rhossiliensis TaxID=111463 RepID=A0A9P8MTC0_9HYPO|nr:hybrid PKS-NRPS synthetase fsa1 [Hirsutella rhossiliensis]KAH0961783.1 hybrid PKS-NRPS synthetase fsa1 [Hirsutella rhossiliensis]